MSFLFYLWLSVRRNIFFARTLREHNLSYYLEEGVEPQRDKIHRNSQLLPLIYHDHILRMGDLNLYFWLIREPNSYLEWRFFLNWPFRRIKNIERLIMAIYNIYVVFITKRLSAFKKCDQRNLHIWSRNTFLICINIMLLKHQESYWVLCLRIATENNNNNNKNIFKKKKKE